MQIPSMPFKILALAPFKPGIKIDSTRTPVPVDITSLDPVISSLGISLYLPLPNELCHEGGVDIHISGMKDFHPDQLVQKTPYLKNIKEAIEAVIKSRAAGQPFIEIARQIRVWPNLPSITIDMDQETEKKSSPVSSSAIDSILDMVALPEEEKSFPEKKTGITEQLNQVLQEILTHIYSNPEFQALESVWQGVKFFLKQGMVKQEVLLSLVPISASAFTESLASLTPSLIDDPPSLAIVDLPFDNSPSSLEQMEAIATFAETLMMPSLCWVTEKFFYIERWDELKKLPFLPNHLDQAHYAKWHRLEQSTFGNWLAVTGNRVLARYPYGKENKPRTIDFTEKDYAWIAPVWAVAALMAQSAEKTGWPTRLINHQSIRLSDLPLNTLHPDKPIPTETLITNERMEHFKRIGMMPVTGIERKDIAFTPVEITVSGSSFAYHVFLSMFTKFIFWCLDTLDKNAGTPAIEADFIRAIKLFFEKKEAPAPNDIMVSAGPPNPEDRIPLKIAFTPPPDVLLVKDPIVLEFMW